MITAQRSERGQALVLIVLTIVGMMGFAALAVDLGRVYAERRRAQSAVDAAALGGAYVCSQRGSTDVPCDFDTFIDAAEPLMQENDYFPSPTVEIFYDTPPVGGPYDGQEDYFQVRLRTKIDPIFAQFVYGGPMNIEVEAVTRATTSDNIAPGNAITATSRTACKGIVFNGGMGTSVTGGNVFSNADGNVARNSCDTIEATGNSGNITLINSELIAAGNYTGRTSIINGSLSTGADHQTFPAPPEPYCDDLPVTTANLTTKNLPAGRHPTLPNQFRQGGAWTIDEGMHCFYTNLELGGGASLTSTGYGVFIVMKQGGVNVQGNASFNLRAIFGGPDGHGYKDGKDNQWSGMLLYMTPSNTNGVDLLGSSGSSITGTIYAPGPRVPDTQEKCNVGGNGTALAVKSALICSSVGIGGSAGVTIVYRPTQNYRMPPTVELIQ